MLWPHVKRNARADVSAVVIEVVVAIAGASVASVYAHD
jgi:hypothetical protein